MDWMIWVGVGLSILGMAGILFSVYLVRTAKRENLDDEAMRARLQRILPVNIAALMLSVLGLGIVTIGLIFAA